MLICLRVWKNPDEKWKNYEVFDTEDDSKDVVRKDVIVSALRSGIDIVGLSLHDGKIRMDSTMCHGDGYYIFGKRVEAWLYEIFYPYWTTHDVIIVRGKSGRSNLSRIYLMDNLIGEILTDSEYSKEFVDYPNISIYKYKDKYVFDVSCCYIDKHFYGEDREEYFYKQELFVGSKRICGTKYIKVNNLRGSDLNGLGTKDNPIGVIREPKIKYEGFDVNLDLYV